MNDDDDDSKLGLIDWLRIIATCCFAIASGVLLAWRG